jgi:hypothetical protein
MLLFQLMLKKCLNIFIAILLLLPLFAGETEFFRAASHASPSFQKTCDMDDCNPNMPKCPLCPSFRSTNLYLFHESVSYFPLLSSSLILLSMDTMSDQGVVRTIFRPPTSLS